MTYDDPRMWFVDLDKHGWFVANHDPSAGDVTGERYNTEADALAALHQHITDYLANQAQEQQ